MLVRFDNSFNNINLDHRTYLKDVVSSTIHNQNSLVNCDTYSFIPSTRQTIDMNGDMLTQVKKLVSHFYPELSPIRHIELDRISGAMTNAVYFVTIEQRRFVLRIYGHGCEVLLDRQKELEWLARLTPLRVGARLLGTFDNGRLEEYLPSKTLTNDCIRETNTSLQIAKLLAKLHSIVQFYPPSSSSSSSLEVWSCIYKWFHTLSVSDVFKNKNNDGFSIVGISLNDIKKCQQFLDKINPGNETVVFAHNDLQYGNILRLNANDELVAVDFEYAGYNPRSYDIANHFIEWQYDYSSNDSALAKAHKAPTVQQQKLFLATYLEHHHLSSTTTLDQLWNEVNCWTMACHLYWGLWAFVQVLQSDIDFDYASYGTQRLNMFKQCFHTLLNGNLELP
ncbi:kinase-like domain-containing protein [Cunninghamella echinulata]|nr:kinase-like domain-containing protein [Cunninghamella echinulata]